MVVTFVGGVSVGDNGYVKFSVSGKTPNVVKKTTTDTWQWKTDKVNGISLDCDFDVSGPHTVYTILAEPQPPWNNAFANQRNAWITALDFAIVTCGANGKKTEVEALSQITQSLFDSRVYPTDGWGWEQYIYNFDLRLWEYSDYMQNSHLERWANCLDSALGLWSTGSVVGSSLTPVRRNTANSPRPYTGYHAYVRHQPSGSSLPRFYDCMPYSAQRAAKINYSQEQIDNAWSSGYPNGPVDIDYWQIR